MDFLALKFYDCNNKNFVSIADEKLPVTWVVMEQAVNPLTINWQNMFIYCNHEQDMCTFI